MVRLAIVRGLTYTDIAQVRSRRLIPTYANAYRWTGNSADAEDLTVSIFHNVKYSFRKPEVVPVVDERLAELTSEAIVRHWSERYGADGLNLTASALTDSRPALETLLTDLTAESHHMLILRFARRRALDAIADQLRVSARETDRRMFMALTQVAARLGFAMPSAVRPDLEAVSGFVTDLVVRRRPARFETTMADWPAMVAACHIHAAIAGNDLPTQRFVRSVESAPRRPVTELRIWSA